MPVPLPRLLLAVAVLALLARSAWVAWARRDLARAVWRSVRPRHVIGSLVLLVTVVAVTVAAATAVPLLARGLGDLFATTGNVVFAPVDVAAEAAGGAADTGPNLWFVGIVTVFLAVLALLLPWFAFVEEEVFRAGAEAWSLPVRIGAALVFGAAHLVMLVPLAAAIGIGVAGFAYGEVYRRRARRTGPPAPAAARRAFRPTRRSRAAIRRQAVDAVAAVELREHQTAAVFTSTVWHTTFNSLVVTLVWLALVLDELLV